MIKTKIDKRVKWITLIVIILVIAFGVWIYLRSGGSFLPAWITILGVAVFFLVGMSIPKGVIITDRSIEIHCLVELTSIPFDEIKTIKMADKRDIKVCMPLFGIFGFFGYYGLYYSFSLKDTFRLYAKRWDNLVIIERNDEKIFVINVDDSTEFVRRVGRMIK